MKIEKSEIILKIKGIRIKLTEEEAEELRDLMNKEFPDESLYSYFPWEGYQEHGRCPYTLTFTAGSNTRED